MRFKFCFVLSQHTFIHNCQNSTRCALATPLTSCGNNSSQEKKILKGETFKVVTNGDGTETITHYTHYSDNHYFKAIVNTAEIVTNETRCDICGKKRRDHID